MPTYFISDIHLHAGSKEQAKVLFDFLQTQGRAADAIYILGDLFAIWLGDDIREPYSEELISVLRDLQAQQVPVYFMHGNRDFLVGRNFAERSGCQLLKDPCIIKLYDEDVLLTHGDQLCTLDVRYQRFRRFVQNKILNWIFLRMPVALRRKIGKFISSKSRGSAQNPATYDVEERTAVAWFEKHGVKTMIHGHTHRPAMHNHGNYRRIVLGDWQPNCAKILRVDGTKHALTDLLS